jgi:uncharacterized YccA/Bax inhibitor family protein
MESSNPVLTRLERAARGLDASTRPMTITGTTSKALALLLVTMFSAGLVWSQIAAGQTGLIWPAVLIGGFGGFGLSLLTVFKPLWARITAPLYAAVEGLFLGAFSAMLNAQYPGVPMQAVALTFLIAGVVLGAYRMGLLRATPTFQRVIVGALVGIALFYVGSMIASLFGVTVSYFTSTSPWAIGINAVIAGVAALTLVLDFSLIEDLVAQRGPQALEWYAAFGILTSLVMLFVELARLLSRLRR